MEGPRVQVIWKGKSLLVPIGEDDDVEKLRFVLCELTGVPPRNQKLFGWKAKTVDDTTLLTALGLGAETKKLSLVGNADADIVAFDADAAAAAAAQVADDEDVGLEEVAPESREENVRKLALRVQSSPVVELHPAREGMRLLVLDVGGTVPGSDGGKGPGLTRTTDYTIFDHKSPVESVATQTRPWLHEFLATAYAQFDIVIWSATSMKVCWRALLRRPPPDACACQWVELKCQQMGMLSHPDYRLRFLLDERPMFTIENVHRGRVRWCGAASPSAHSPLFFLLLFFAEACASRQAPRVHLAAFPHVRSAQHRHV